MESKKLGLVHTSATLVPVFDKLCKRSLPKIEIFNIVDDSLIKDVITKDKLTPHTAQRVVNYVGSAEAAGADYILVTCSSIGTAVETAASLVNVPVLRVDQPMADMAVKTGTKIGVIATLPTTLEPTSDLVRRRAAAIDKDIELTSRLCEGAFDALMGGNPEKHDAMVKGALKELSKKVDTILLAQASMGRVANQLDETEQIVPILTSPPNAVKYLASIL